MNDKSDDSVMSINQPRSSLLALSRARIAIRPGWGRLLIAVIAIDYLLAAGTWYTVGVIIH
jgi:hypothetical protein